MNRIPLAAKLLYTAWMVVWVPVYWQQNGPSNFLWLCDFANWVLLGAIWIESPLLASSQLSGVFLIQVIWAADFLSALLFRFHPVGGTEYMFDAATPLWVRAFSLFHLWSVPLLVWLVRRIGSQADRVCLDLADQIEYAAVFKVRLIVHEAPQLLDELSDRAVDLFAGVEKQERDVAHELFVRKLPHRRKLVHRAQPGL